jgi:hypothetical protein
MKTLNKKLEKLTKRLDHSVIDVKSNPAVSTPCALHSTQAGDSQNVSA